MRSAPHHSFRRHKLGCFQGAGEEAPHLYCFLPVIFMVQVVITICTVAVIAEFTVCKTITIPETEDAEGICTHDHYIDISTEGSSRSS